MKVVHKYLLLVIDCFIRDVYQYNEILFNFLEILLNPAEKISFMIEGISTPDQVVL